MARAIVEAAKVRGKRAPHLLMVSNCDVQGLPVVGSETWTEIKTSIGMDCDRAHIFFGFFAIRHYDLTETEFEKRNSAPIVCNTQEKALTSPKKVISERIIFRAGMWSVSKSRLRETGVHPFFPMPALLATVSPTLMALFNQEMSRSAVGASTYNTLRGRHTRLHPPYSFQASRACCRLRRSEVGQERQSFFA